VRLLLDTHAFLWWLQDDSRLSATARRVISDPASTVFVSAASVWEAAIKASLGKLKIEADLPEEISANGFVELPIAAHHAWRARKLPRHHDDPFDRMLVAQAGMEELTVVTHDPAFRGYAIPLLPA
jgi:PIN domain nuclease of toxin-antitoxin system